MLSATMSIVKSDGPGVLLNGLGPTVIGYGVEGAMKFGVYEVAKPIFGALIPNSKPLAFAMASIIAGAIAAVLLCPMESLRIRQVTDQSYANDSLLTGLPKLIRADGFISLFGGVWAMLAKQVCPTTNLLGRAFEDTLSLLTTCLLLFQGPLYIRKTSFL